MPQDRFHSSPSRRGGALVVALVVLISSVSLLTGIQHVLTQRNVRLRMRRNDVHLESALLLGLERAAAVLALDGDLLVDHPDEDWAQPREFTTSDGVRLRLTMTDAQGGFDLNRLRRIPRPGDLRTDWDALEDLLAAADLPVEPDLTRNLREDILENETVFPAPESIMDLAPRTRAWLEAGLPFTALPPSATGRLPVNLNSVDPMVLRALAGDALAAWADTVLSAREQEPLRSVSTQTQFLPPPVARLLNEVFSVSTRHVGVELEAETDDTVQTLSALLRREPGGGVEVLRCRW